MRQCLRLSYAQRAALEAAGWVTRGGPFTLGSSCEAECAEAGTGTGSGTGTERIALCGGRLTGPGRLYMTLTDSTGDLSGCANGLVIPLDYDPTLVPDPALLFDAVGGYFGWADAPDGLGCGPCLRFKAVLYCPVSSATEPVYFTQVRIEAADPAAPGSADPDTWNPITSGVQTAIDSGDVFLLGDVYNAISCDDTTPDTAAFTATFMVTETPP